MLYQYLPDDLLPQLMDLHYMVIVDREVHLLLIHQVMMVHSQTIHRRLIHQMLI
jgi:hypothetical protein